MKVARLLFSLVILAGNAFAGTQIVKDGLVIEGLASGNVASKAQALELQGEEDVGLGLFRKGVASRNNEAFIAYWAYDDRGYLQKTMSLSNTWGNASHSNGFAINRYNAAYVKNGVGRDDLSIRQFGGIGIGLFTITDDDAPNAVGDHLTKLLIRGNTAIYKHDNSITSGFSVRNTHDGSGAVLRTRFGNDAREDAFTIDVYGSKNHAAPRSVEIINHQNAPLVLGTNSKSAASLEPVGGGAALLVQTRNKDNAAPGDIRTDSALWVGAGVPAPVATKGFVALYVDRADGKLKVRFPNGTVRVIRFE